MKFFTRMMIEKVAAMPTGLMLIDMRILKKMRKPYFEYDWVGDGKACEHCGCPKPGPRAEKASTEDCFFTREITLGCFDEPEAGVFCNWDAWAYHIKLCEIGKPQELTFDHVNRRFVEAVENRRRSDETLQYFDLNLPQVAPPEPSNGQMTFNVLERRTGEAVSVNETEFGKVIEREFSEYRNGSADRI